MTLLLVSTVAFAEGETTETYLSGSTTTSAGNYTVQSTNEVYHFQGDEYEVYRVYYDNPEMNMKIAVRMEGPCNSFIAYTDSYWFRYQCGKDGFGLRKVLFNTPQVIQKFNPKEYQNQTVLLRKRSIEKKEAVGLIAAYVPKLQS